MLFSRHDITGFCPLELSTVVITFERTVQDLTPKHSPKGGGTYEALPSSQRVYRQVASLEDRMIFFSGGVIHESPRLL